MGGGVRKVCSVGGVKYCCGRGKILRYENRIKKNKIVFSTQTDERASNLSDTISEICNSYIPKHHY